MTTYERIKDACKARGVAITAMEKDLGFGRGSIGKMKNGKQGSTSAERLQKIADYLDVPIAQLTGAETSNDNYYIDPEVQEIAEEMATRSELKVLFKASRKMTKEQIEAINQMINTMK